jgi:hypothetical protein
MKTIFDSKKELGGVHYTTKHTGKMRGIFSISTSVLENPFCKKRKELDECICSKCYASRYMKMRSNMEKVFRKNTLILTSEILPDDKLPLVCNLYFRLEAFGDLINKKQVINYFNLCNKNPQTKFALWTKNPQFIHDVIIHDNICKPNNLQIIYSSLIINKQGKTKYDFVDKIFTVFDKEHAKSVDINCGSKSCITCKLCYEKNDIKYINEKLK